MAGAIASVLGGSALSSIFGNSIMGSLLDKFGLDEIADAITDVFKEALGTALKQIIDMSPMPDFMKDAAKDVVDLATGGKSGASQEAVDAVKDSPWGDVITDMAEETAQGAANEADENSEGSSSGGGMTWLHALATAIGKAQSNLAGRIEDKAEALQAEYDSENKDAFFEAQADFSATSQMFSMVSNQGSTALKTIGEALAAMARKQ